MPLLLKGDEVARELGTSTKTVDPSHHKGEI